LHTVAPPPSTEKDEAEYWRKEADRLYKENARLDEENKNARESQGEAVARARGEEGKRLHAEAALIQANNKIAELQQQPRNLPSSPPDSEAQQIERGMAALGRMLPHLARSGVAFSFSFSSAGDAPKP